MLLLASADFDAIAGTHCPLIAVVDAAEVVVVAVAVIAVALYLFESEKGIKMA